MKGRTLGGPGNILCGERVCEVEEEQVQGTGEWKDGPCPCLRDRSGGWRGVTDKKRGGRHTD